MKQVFETLKVIWKNPRGHAILVLGLYFLFFAIVFLLVDVKDNSQEIQTMEEKYINLKSYKYDMTISGEEEYVLEVENKDDVMSALYSEQTYVYINNNWINAEGTSHYFEIDPINYTPKKLAIAFEKGDLIATTNYKDQSIKKTYELDCAEIDTTKSGICEVSFLERENQIEKLEIEMEDYQVEIIYKD